ncbi:MAG: nodulation protein NfeD [Thermodesulfobacteriota bacterium]|nr:MAG: nodulation protein NfeD [Thermodesulfobacteriota bacterium]
MKFAKNTGEKLIFLLLLFSLPLIVFSGGNTVNLIEVDSIINPVSAEYIIDSIKATEKESAQCLIIKLDTPGGLDTSMRQIIKEILNTHVPIIVYVAPDGARAASAGVLITMAAHVAAMAPGTNIGAAHPVSMGGGKMSREMSEKVENDAVAYIQSIATKRKRNIEWAEKAVRESVSIKADEALKIKVIDLVSPNLDDLLQKLDGREVDIDGKKVILATKGATVKDLKMTLREKILATLTDPNIAYILMMLGVAGLYFELAHPGAIFPGVIGAICLILAFYSFQVLSVNYAGILFIILAIILFLAEIKVASYGLLSIGGTICLLFGSLMLFDSTSPYLRPSLTVLIATIVITAGFFITVATIAFRAYIRKPASGSEGMIGLVGVVINRIAPRGKVFVHGEYWNAYSEEVIEEGEEVEVVEINGLKIKVKKFIKKDR